MLKAGAISLLINGQHRFAKCWKFTRQDGVILRFTDHDQKLTVDGEVYEPSGAVNATAETRREGLDNSTREINGAITSDKITEADLRLGKYRNTVVREFCVDHLFPFAAKFWIKTYYIELTKFDGEIWTVSVSSDRGKFTVQVGDNYQRTCRWRKFGDSDCGVDASSYSVAGNEVSAVLQPLLEFTTDLSSDFEDDYFNNGTILWTSGPNAGLYSEVKNWTSATQTLELYAPASFDISATDEFTITPDCDRTESTCKNRYNNFNEFGGFPDIPGTDDALATPNPT